MFPSRGPETHYSTHNNLNLIKSSKVY